MDKITVYKLPIHNFSRNASHEIPGTVVTSDEFPLDNSDIKCCLLFEPVSRKEAYYEEYSSLFLVVKDFADKPYVILDYKLWVENNCGEELGTRASSGTVFHPAKDGWGFSQFAHHFDLYPPISSFARDDFVYICCEVRRRELGEYDELPPIDVDLRNKLWELHENGINGECEIQAGPWTYTVDKRLLMANSEVFETMLLCNGEEAQTNVVVIDKFAPVIVTEFVNYLTRRQVDHLDKHAEDLFRFAQKYAIEDLKDLCVNSMCKTFSKNNLIKRLAMAIQYKDDRLKKCALKATQIYKRAKCFYTSTESKAWKKVMKKNRLFSNEIKESLFGKAY